MWHSCKLISIGVFFIDWFLFSIQIVLFRLQIDDFKLQFPHFSLKLYDSNIRLIRCLTWSQTTKINYLSKWLVLHIFCFVDDNQNWYGKFTIVFAMQCLTINERNNMIGCRMWPNLITRLCLLPKLFNKMCFVFHA